MKSSIYDLFNVFDLYKALENDKEYQKLKDDYKVILKPFLEKFPYELDDLYKEITAKQEEIENYKRYVCFKKGFSNGVNTILESLKEN